MIDKVLILGIRRGNSLIPSGEIQQMIGRCGRSYTESGKATLIVPEKDLLTANEYITSRPAPISSTMNEVGNVAFHCIPAIYHNKITDRLSFERWYSRTLAALQGKNILWETIRDYLCEKECLEMIPTGIRLTELGKISYYFYYSPERLWSLKNKLAILINEQLLEDEFAFSWVLSYQHRITGEVDVRELAEYKSAVTALGLYFSVGETLEGYVYHCLLTRKKPNWLKFEIADTRQDIGRLFGALKCIAEIYNPSVSKFIEIWEICFVRRLPYPLGKIALEFDGAPNSVIFELNSFGVHTVSELVTKRPRVEKYGSATLKNFIHGHELYQKAT